MNKLYSIIFVLALFVSILAQNTFAQREVTVKSMASGGVVDGLPQAILADSAARADALPQQTTYILENGGIYPIATEMENVDYLLHIRTADLDGAKAALVPAPRADGGYSDFFKFRNDGLLENLIIEAMRTQDPYAANRHNIEIRNSSTLTVKGCEIMHDTPGSAFSVWEESPEDRNSLFLEDCFIHSIGHHKSLGGNGRVLGVRSNMETLSLINVTFFNLTDRVFRHGKTGWDVKKVIVDHCTGLTTSGWHGFLQLGKSHEVSITNNIFFNPIAFGSHYNRVLGGSEFEQSQPENDLMYVVTLDTVFADSKILVENNNIFWEQQYKDLWAAYPDSTTAPGVLTPTVEGANSSTGEAYFSEALTFVAPPPSTYEYHELGLTDINATTYPENFYFGLSSDIDGSYGTSAKSYTAAGGGFPLGDLNAYPDQKQAWNDAGRPIVTAVNDQISSIPKKFELSQNYPNPFNPTTTINFSIPVKGNYSLRVFNIVGQEITTLINGQVNAGNHNLRFDASQLSSGIYFYTLSGDNVNISRKMILMK